MEIQVAKDIKVNVTVHGMSDVLPIPYTFTIGAVSFLGVLYFHYNSPDDSWTEGIWAGVINGTYKLTRNEVEACGANGLLKACIKIEFGRRKLFGRLCTRKLNGGWDCGDWQEIASW